jgi:chaperone BCS1
MRQTCEDAEHDEQDGDIEADNDKHPPNGITLSAFLNIIDGLTAQEGRILIMLPTPLRSWITLSFAQSAMI